MIGCGTGSLGDFAPCFGIALSVKRLMRSMKATTLLLLSSAVSGLQLPHAPTTHTRPAFSPARSPMSARPGAPFMLAGEKSSLPFILDIGTKGGIVFYSILGIVLPFVAYNIMTGPMELDIVLAGNVVLVGYVGLGTVAWTGSYVFRVANKDMTYAQQLKDYENAVIQKRFEELSEEEVDALMGEIYPEKTGSDSPAK